MALFFSLLLLKITFGFPLETVQAVEPEYPSSTEEFYVYDETNVLSADTEEFILSVNRHYEDTQEQPQVVVAVVESIGEVTPEEYAVNLFEEWEIGNTDYDNGILILLSETEREIKIEVGYGLEGAITDAGAGRILDRHLNLLSEDNYDEGLKNIFTDVAIEVNDEYGYDHETIFSGYAVEPQQSDSDDGTSAPFLFIVIVIIFMLSSFFGGGGGGPGSRRRRGPYYYGGHRGGGFGGFGSGGGFGGSGGGSFGGGGRSGGGGAGRGF